MHRIRYNPNQSSCNYTDTIIYISIIHQVIKNYGLYNYSNNIINEYNKTNTASIAQQYIRKFTYIYNKTHIYYCNHDNKLTIQEIAITNLYLISQINSKNSLFFLIKYLII